MHSAHPTLYIGSDHAGFRLKEFLLGQLSPAYSMVDIGCPTEDSVDYPVIARSLTSALLGSQRSALGIILCGSGNGVCMSANRSSGVRAALCWNVEIAALARMHNNANVLCLPARFLEESVALEIVLAFLHTPFEGGRHLRRIELLDSANPDSV